MAEASRPNFDRVVPIYDFCKTLLFFGSIERCQYYHLSQLKGRKKLLIIGGGTGRIIEKISSFTDFDSLVYVDNSREMISKAKRFTKLRCPELYDKIEFQCADALSITENLDFDAIILPFVLDCFTNEKLKQLGGKMHTWMAPGSLLLISDFQESNSSLFSRMLSSQVLFLVAFL